MYICIRIQFAYCDSLMWLEFDTRRRWETTRECSLLVQKGLQIEISGVWSETWNSERLKCRCILRVRISDLVKTTHKNCGCKGGCWAYAKIYDYNWKYSDQHSLLWTFIKSFHFFATIFINLHEHIRIYLCVTKENELFFLLIYYNSCIRNLICNLKAVTRY